ncbi:MAG TPA: AsmA family protein [Bryobacteraceae bacterium]|jgi:AsmA protein
MRARFVVIPLVLVALVIAAGLAFLAGNIDHYRPKVQAELQEKLNRPVTITRLGLKIFPLSIKVEGLTIGDSPAFSSTRPFATASEVYVSASLFSLIRGNPEVKDLTLDKPQIELVRNAAGVWNFSTLGSSTGSGGGTQQSQFSLGELKIKDGQLGYTDLATKQAREVYDHIDLDLTDFAPGKQFGIELGVHFPGEGTQTLAFKGKAGPLGQGAALPPMSGHLALQQVSLSAVNRFAAGTIPPQTDTVASGDADISSEGDSLTGKGGLKLENTIIHGAKLDYPISANFDLSADRKQEKIQVRSADVALGATKFTASGDVDAGAKPTNLNVQLSTKNSSITELAKLAGALGVAFNPAYKVTGTVSADLSAKGPLNAPQLNGSFTAKGLQASGGEIKQPVSVPEIVLALSPDTVHSTNFTVQSGSTTLAAAFTLSQYTTKNMNVDATLKTDGANIAELLNIAKAYGATAAQGTSGSGKLSLDVHVQGPVSDSSKLAYAGTASIANASLSTPALTKPLAISSANAKFSQNSVALDNLVATLGSTTARGSLEAKDFAAPQVQFALSADKIDTTELEQVVAPAPHPAANVKAAPANGPSLLQLTTGSGTLAVGTIKAQDFVLTNVKAKCQLNRGVIQLSPLTAGVFGGQENGSLTADMRPATPQCAVKAKLAGVDANALLSAVSSVKNTLYGGLAADSDMRFALASSADLARTLNGTLAFNLANGQLKNVNILGEISKVGKFLNSAALQSSGSGTALKKFSGTLNIVNGVASTNNLTAVLDAGSLAASGALNLVNQDVNMHMTATLGSSTSQSVGGSKVGGFLTTALANNKGELVLPVLVTGNMAHPIFAPDVQAMAKMKASGILGSVLGQKGAGGVLGGILGGAKGQSGSQQQSNPVNSILDQFKKKKP